MIQLFSVFFPCLNLEEAIGNSKNTSRVTFTLWFWSLLKIFQLSVTFISFGLHSFTVITCTYFVYCNLDWWQGRLTAAELCWLKAPFSVVHNLAKIQLLRLKFVILIACLKQNYFGRVQQSHSSTFQKWGLSKMLAHQEIKNNFWWPFVWLLWAFVILNRNVRFVIWDVTFLSVIQVLHLCGFSEAVNIYFFFCENSTSLSQIVNSKAIKPTLSLKGLKKS